uniref:hypothetical protein n=1 Tax=Rhizobium sp. F40D2 TaxID=3453141 RepID=UPI003F26FC81
MRAAATAGRTGTGGRAALLGGAYLTYLEGLPDMPSVVRIFKTAEAEVRVEGLAGMDHVAAGSGPRLAIAVGAGFVIGG